jgi:hypothetical protein
VKTGRVFPAKIVAVAKEGEPVKIRLNQLVLVPSSAVGGN